MIATYRIGAWFRALQPANPARVTNPADHGRVVGSEIWYQLKVAASCGLEFWTNFAVLGGAWIFLILLIIAIVNQWLTLSSISQELMRQRTKLATDYAAISDQFLDIFTGLSGRITWHRWALGVVAIIALAGAVFASFVCVRLTTIDPRTCWTG